MTSVLVERETLVLVEEARAEVLVETQERVQIATESKQGPRGIQGIPGPAGGATYTHTQSIAAAVWTVPHNLGRHPSVAVTDHLGNLVHPDVCYLDDDLVQITHGTPLTGFAYCN